MLTPAERRRSLAAAIACITVYGLSIGEGGPLMSLLLEARGTNAAITGLNAGAAFIGVLVGPMLTPRWIRWFGIRTLLVTCFALDIATFMTLKVFDGLTAWFVLRVLLGLIGSTLFTTSEAWISLLAGDTARGRIIGIYAAALSVGFALGPLLLSITGIEGWPPFVLNGVIVAVAAVPVAAVGDLARGLAQERAGNPLTFFAKAPLIVSAVAVFGVYETAFMTLLPIWGVRAGLGTAVAAGTLSAVYFGAIVLQVPIGWLSDKAQRITALRLCGAVGLTGAVLLIAGSARSPVLFGLLFVWGGVVSGIYPIALGMAGDRFAGSEMVSANAAIIMAYGLGSLVGPALGGAAMDLWNPQGLFVLFALLFGVFLAATVRRVGRRR